MATPPQKVSLYATNDLKNTTDDALAPHLTSLPAPYKFTQDHTLMNVRLALGYTAVVVAGALFAADYKLGWADTRAYTLPACVAYFVLNSALSLWMWKMEAGTVFVGTRAGGQKLTLKSSSVKNSGIYTLRVIYTAPSGKVFEDKVITSPFTRWFNTWGYIQPKDLQAWLAENIEPLKALKEESAKKEAKTVEAGAQSIPEALIYATLDSDATGSGFDTPSAASGKKNRGKKKA